MVSFDTKVERCLVRVLEIVTKHAQLEVPYLESAEEFIRTSLSL